jgi:YfiH family protein
MSFYVHPTPLITVFFGSQQDAFIPADLKTLHNRAAVNHKVFAGVAQAMGLEQIVFLHQTHSALGTVVTGIDKYQLFIQEGDFMITSSKHLGIAVATADCIPLVISSTKYPLVGVVHAGWRGTVAGITTQALDSFLEQIDLFEKNTQVTKEEKIKTIQVIIGPAARVCCYQVKADFLDTLTSGFKQFVQKRDGKLFFDGIAYNKQLLYEHGITENAVSDTSICTMHESGYCSHRASGGSPERNYTVVALK